MPSSSLPGRRKKLMLFKRLGENDAKLASIRLPESLTAHSLKRDSAWRDSCRTVTAGRDCARHPGASHAPGRALLPAPLRPGHDLVITAKGLERGTQKRADDRGARGSPGPTIAVLSGPSFAHDVARGLPTAVTLAADTRPGRPALRAVQGPDFPPLCQRRSHRRPAWRRAEKCARHCRRRR
jgi:glycerol-3-phosphate dehydrogenase